MSLLKRMITTLQNSVYYYANLTDAECVKKTNGIGLGKKNSEAVRSLTARGAFKNKAVVHGTTANNNNQRNTNNTNDELKSELCEIYDQSWKLIERGKRLMERLKSLERGAAMAIKRNDEEQLKQIARDRVVVKTGLKEVVRKIESKRALAERLERSAWTTNEEKSPSLRYETEEEIEEKFRKLEREQERLKIDWLDDL